VCVLSVGQEECFENRPWHHDSKVVCPIVDGGCYCLHTADE
jgi:hypothetical protein